MAVDELVGGNERRRVRSLMHRLFVFASGVSLPFVFVLIRFRRFISTEWNLVGLATLRLILATISYSPSRSMQPRVRRGNRILKRPGDAIGPKTSVSVIDPIVLEAGK